MKASYLRSKRENFFLILMLGGLNAITPISIDMYLPGFVAIAADLHADIQRVALSVSTYFLGYALGQLLYGPLLDRYGRKKPLFIGLSFYIGISVGLIACHSIDVLLLLRFIQGLAGSVASVAAMAMVIDFFPVEKRTGIISLLMLILSVSPMLAPTIGGFIITSWGWRAVFVLLASIALLILSLVIIFLPQGHPADSAVELRPQAILRGFGDILFEPRFYVFSLAGTFSFAGLFVYVAGSPAIFMEHFHVSPKVYGGIFAFLAISFIGGSQLNHYLVKKYSGETILKTTIIYQLGFAAVFLIGAVNNWYGLLPTIGLLFMILLCSGITYPNAAALALAPFTGNAGAASALLGFIQIGIGGLISSGIGLLELQGILPAALIMTVSTAVGLAILLAGKAKTDKPVAGREI